MKYKWKVDPPPIGRYRSFERRGWPTAYYCDENESCAAWIMCEDKYCPADVKTGKHKPLKLHVADYSKPDGNCPYEK